MIVTMLSRWCVLGLAMGLALSATPPVASGQLPAPGVVRGRVIGPEGRPLPAVSVTVRGAADSAAVAGALTDREGRFRIAGLSPGRYRVTASLLGYSPVSRADVHLSAAEPVADLGTLTLTPSAIALEGVRVTGERSTVMMAPDRTIYSTRDMPVASGGMATDVLRSVPELEVDIDGAVSLRGTSARIFLNGRPAPMEGEALQVFLQQFPADRIDRVEVIANPSARYEAEGAGGIVNIVLKKDVELGFSGSAFANASTRGEAGGGGRLAYQRGPLTLFGGGFLRRSDRYNTSYDLRRNLLTEPVTLLEQDAWSDEGGWSGNVDLSAEWKLGERSAVFSEARLYRNGSEGDALVAYARMYEDESVFERYDRSEDEREVRLSTDFTGGFRHVFEPRRHELSLEVEYEGGGDEETAAVRRRFLTPAGAPTELPVELTLDGAREAETELTAQLDYVRPWGERGQVEAGYEGRVENTENTRLLEVFAREDAPVPVRTTDNSFSFRETFHSGYLTLAAELGRWDVQAGVRAELAHTRLTVPGPRGAYESEYLSLFPNANLSYEVAEGREVRLSYSRRIRRPSPWVLNPIDRSNDPLNRTVGNPDIDPQYTHNLSMETSVTEEWGTLRISPYYRLTRGDWTQIKRVDAEGISTVTWENLASVEQYGTSLTASLRPIGGVGGYLSLSGYREVRDASNLSLDYSGAAMRWSARGNVSARVTESTSVQGMLFYTPAREVPQGTISSRLMTHVGIRQQLLGERLSLNLMVRDPLDLWSSSFRTRDPTHVQISRTDWSARSATLSVSYTFGRPPRDRERGEEEPAEIPAQEIH